MGKREEKKREIQQRIINGASELFSEQNFDETTMEQIAERSGVGLGTAYNYYKSKEELFLQIMTKQFEGMMEGAPSPESPAASPVEELSRRIIGQIRIFKRFPKSLWKTMMGISFNSLKKDNKITDLLVSADLKAMENIRKYLDECKEKGILHSTEDSGLLVDLIYGMLFLQIMMYIYTDTLSFDEACERVRIGIRAILKEDS